MKKRVIGAILLLLVGMTAILGLWLWLPRYMDSFQKKTSDAGRTHGKIRLVLDNWIGYFVFRSPEMRKQMHQSGWNLVWEDDGADYAKRMKRLADGEIDFAVATVDSYILNAAKLGFPGIIIMVIDESKGGDAIVARADRIDSLNALKGRADAIVAFAPGSPSHHLAKATAYHFDVPELVPPPGPLLIETKNSEEALKKLLAGKTDVAILWEPDVSRALSHPGIKKIIGTEDTEKLIVDILLVNRQFSKENPQAVKLMLSLYFRVLKKYQDNPQLLREHVEKETGLPAQSIDSMLKGVKWLNLTANCEKWFGIAPPGGHADDGLVRTIQSTSRILVNAGDFASDPIPDEDPYRLTYSAYLEDLFVKGVPGFTSPPPSTKTSTPADSMEARFAHLSDDDWNKLREVGTLKVEPIVFRHGTAELDMLGKEVVDRAVELLKHYPNFRVVIRGHTGTRGDPDENTRLSQERAAAVARYMTVTYNVDPNRIKAVGYGGTQPLPKRPGESERSWQYRLPRVETVLVREEY